jgi:hypothetical protein
LGSNPFRKHTDSRPGTLESRHHRGPIAELLSLLRQCTVPVSLKSGFCGRHLSRRHQPRNGLRGCPFEIQIELLLLFFSKPVGSEESEFGCVGRLISRPPRF